MTEDKRDWRLVRGIGRAVPKLFLDPLRAFCEGETLNECISAFVSAMDDLVAGTSIGPSSSSPGTGR